MGIGLSDTRAEVFARLIARTSDRRLEGVMRTPLRGLILSGVFRELPRRLDRGRAEGSGTDFEFAIGGRRDGGVDRYRVVVVDRTCRVTSGSDGSAPVTLEVGSAPFLRLVAGLENPMQLYMTGVLTVKGDVMAAARLQTLFRMPSR